MVSVAVARRWLQVAALTATLAVVLGACSSTSPTESDPTPSAVDVAPGRDRFAFSYQALGTSVLDCVLPNRRLSGHVYDGESFVLIVDDDAEIRHRDAVTYLDPALFDSGLGIDSWITVPDDHLAGASEMLQRALGTDVASFLRSGMPPADGNATVRAALDTGASPEPVESLTRQDGSPVPGWRVAVPDTETDGRDVAPVLTYWLDDTAVVRLIVQDSRPGEPGQPDPDTGWLIDYQPLPDQAVMPPAPSPTATWDAGLALSAPRRDGCDLEIGPGDDRPPAP